MALTTSTQGSSLADILERVLDKGIVIAGDISVAVADIDLIKIRIRLVVASVDKAEQIGINWWRNDPMFHAGESSPSEVARLQAENDALKTRLELMEKSLLEMNQLLAVRLPVPPESKTIMDE